MCIDRTGRWLVTGFSEIWGLFNPATIASQHVPINFHRFNAAGIINLVAVYEVSECTGEADRTKSASCSGGQFSANYIILGGEQISRVD